MWSFSRAIMTKEETIALNCFATGKMKPEDIATATSMTLERFQTNVAGIADNGTGNYFTKWKDRAIKRAVKEMKESTARIIGINS